MLRVYTLVRNLYNLYTCSYVPFILFEVAGTLVMEFDSQMLICKKSVVKVLYNLLQHSLFIKYSNCSEPISKTLCFSSMWRIRQINLMKINF
jgi:hypothetical protein